MNRTMLLGLLTAGSTLLSGRRRAAAQTGERPLLKTLLDNASATVLEVTYPPGAASPPLQRPKRIVYVAEGPFVLKRTRSGAETQTETLPTGTAYWQDADTSAVANAGTNTVRVILTYLKS